MTAPLKTVAVSVFMLQPIVATAQPTPQPPAETWAQIRNQVAAIAFDPRRFFAGSRGQFDKLTVTYTGDDRGWPVYSIAVREGCFSTPVRGQRCFARLARMVRAPAPPGTLRPRQRGSFLIQRLAERGAISISAALDGAGLEWMESDLDQCPAADAVLRSAGQIEWVARQTYAPRPGELPNIVLHADNVEVTFHSFARRATYSGYVAEGSPASWAVRFAEALEPCWRPATAPAPWRR